MRIVREISHPQCKITIYAWNNRYLIKLEEGLLEQTFKIDQFDVSGEDGLLKIVDDEFIQLALKRFSEMAGSLREAMTRAEP
jgi:hypothetical protein